MFGDIRDAVPALLFMMTISIATFAGGVLHYAPLLVTVASATLVLFSTNRAAKWWGALLAPFPVTWGSVMWHPDPTRGEDLALWVAIVVCFASQGIVAHFGERREKVILVMTMLVVFPLWITLASDTIEFYILWAMPVFFLVTRFKPINNKTLVATGALMLAILNTPVLVATVVQYHMGIDNVYAVGLLLGTVIMISSLILSIKTKSKY